MPVTLPFLGRGLSLDNPLYTRLTDLTLSERTENSIQSTIQTNRNDGQLTDGAVVQCHKQPVSKIIDRSNLEDSSGADRAH